MLCPRQGNILRKQKQLLEVVFGVFWVGQSTTQRRLSKRAQKDFFAEAAAAAERSATDFPGPEEVGPRAENESAIEAQKDVNPGRLDRGGQARRGGEGEKGDKCAFGAKRRLCDFHRSEEGNSGAVEEASRVGCITQTRFEAVFAGEQQTIFHDRVRVRHNSN